MNAEETTRVVCATRSCRPTPPKRAANGSDDGKNGESLIHEKMRSFPTKRWWSDGVSSARVIFTFPSLFFFWLQKSKDVWRLCRQIAVRRPNRYYWRPVRRSLQTLSENYVDTVLQWRSLPHAHAYKRSADPIKYTQRNSSMIIKLYRSSNFFLDFRCPMRPHVPCRPAALTDANIGGVVAADVVLLCRRPWALWTDQRQNQSWLLLLWPQQMFWVIDANAAGLRCQESRTSKYTILSFLVQGFFFLLLVFLFLGFSLSGRFYHICISSDFFRESVMLTAHPNTDSKKRTEEKTTNRTRQRNGEKLSMASVGMYLLCFACLSMLEICCCNWCLRAHFVHICPARILRHHMAGKIMNSVSFGADDAHSTPTIPHRHPSNVMYCLFRLSSIEFQILCKCNEMNILCDWLSRRRQRRAIIKLCTSFCGRRIVFRGPSISASRRYYFTHILFSITIR